MPASAVKPSEEQIWRRAKAKAEALGHKDDWAYIMTIFQRMKKSLAKSYTIPTVFSGYRIPGQVPNTSELPTAVKNVAPKPKPLSEAMLQGFHEPILRPETVTRGLGFDQQTNARWTKFIAKTAQTARNELVFRKLVMEQCREEKLDPIVTKALIQRGLSYWRYVQKAYDYFDVRTVEQLSKGEARGGKYHRRIPKDGGGYRYVYDESKYAKRQDAHINGEEASLAYVTKQVVGLVEKAGKAGCPIKELKPLVRKFGADRVASVLKNNAGGKIKYENKKIWLNAEV